MAYTYDEFMRTAGSSGMLNRFSQQDLEAARANPEYGHSMLRMYQDRDRARTAEQRLLADESANQIRKSYGVGIGPNGPVTSVPYMQTAAERGDAYDPNGNGAFRAANAVATTSAPVANKTAKKTPSTTTGSVKKSAATGSGLTFDYDPDQDPRMAAYRKEFLREAERAREDTMATAAAMSGGVPSSYAVGAADQAGNYFVSQLTDKIPELYEDAYNQQLQEWEKALAIYQIMGDNAPKEYLDILGIKKKKKKADSGAAPSGTTGTKPAVQNDPAPGVNENGTNAETTLTTAEKAKKIQESALRGEITPNQAQALLKQL